MDQNGANEPNEPNRLKWTKMHQSVSYGSKSTKWIDQTEEDQNAPMWTK